MKFDMTGWPRVAPDSKIRCQSNDSRGQCILQQVEGSQYCPIHGGTHAIRKHEEEERRAMYQLKFNQTRVAELGNPKDGGIKSLVHEIAILRGMMEIMYNTCKDPTDIALRSGPIGDLIMKIEKLVTATHKLDKDLGVMMDEAQVVALSQEFIEIVARHVSDIAVMEDISNEIASAIENRGHNRVQ